MVLKQINYDHDCSTLKVCCAYATDVVRVVLGQAPTPHFDPLRSCQLLRLEIGYLERCIYYYGDYRGYQSLPHKSE